MIYQPGSPLIVGLDPSVHSLGFAFVTRQDFVFRVGSIKQLTSMEHDYHARAMYMSQEIAKIVETTYHLHGTEHIHIVSEVPDNWQNQKGIDSKNAGDIQVLYMQAGMMLGILSRLECVASIAVVQPKGWKGQTPKSIIMDRARRLLARQPAPIIEPRLSSDALEALMLAYTVNHGRKTSDPALSVYLKPYHLIYTRGEIHGTFEVTQRDLV